MYRIKTDIRQYKCESIDKVEKLIRNWVIRPNDLIYHSDERDWLPIGEHPSFEKLFGILEEREANEPDTVVTDDHPLLRNGAGATPEEATQITERPNFEDDDEDVMDSRETDIFDADQIAESLAERDRQSADESGETSDPEAEEDSAEEDDSVDDDETNESIDETLDEEADELDEDALRKTLPVEEGSGPQPPEPPEGVEPPVNDEITVMTDKTLEMMKIEDSEAEEVVEEEEATQVAERPTENDEEATQVKERPTEDDAAGDDDETEAKILVSAPESPGESKAAKGVGRHDLPEEFFATNEISGPIFEESAKVIDDLAAMEAERKAGSVDDEWDAIEDNLEEASGGEALGLRDTDEIKSIKAREAAAEAGEGADEDDDEILVDPLEETPIPAADEWDEDVSHVDSETTEPGEVASPEDFISDGYKMPLPFAIGPDEKDVALGLKRSRKSVAEKDAAFPYPVPKKRGEVHERVYYFSKKERPDLSVPIVLGVIIVCLLIATLVAIC